MGIRLIKFNGKKGIIKCTHIEKENTIKLLNSIKKMPMLSVMQFFLFTKNFSQKGKKQKQQKAT